MNVLLLICISYINAIMLSYDVVDILMNICNELLVRQSVAYDLILMR
jgi:hypothetical protein